MGVYFETVAPGILSLLWNEISRAAALWLHLVAWVAGQSEQLLGSQSALIVLWLLLLSVSVIHMRSRGA